MKKNILLDPGILPFQPLQKSIEQYLIKNKLSLINDNPFKNGWYHLKSECEFFTYSQLESTKYYELNSDIKYKYTALLQDIINDHRTILIYERVKKVYLWNSLFNRIHTIEKMVFNSLRILLEVKPDLVLFHSTPHNINSWILSKTAEFIGIKVNFIQRSPLPWRCWLVEGLDEQKLIFPSIDRTLVEEDYLIFDKYLQLNSSDYNTAIPSYEKKRIENRGNKFWSLKKEIFDCLKHPINFLKILPKRKLYNAYNTLVTPNLDLTKKYIVFFLHYQPERTSLPEGGFFAQQWLIIRIISLSLPKGWKMLVKEHPSTFTGHYDIRYRNPDFYYNISKLNNVELVSLETDTFDLIDSSQFVATITGTVGVQALFRGKPVLVFGAASYRNVFGVYEVSDVKNVEKTIHSIILVDSFKKLVEKSLSKVLSKSISASAETIFETTPTDFYTKKIRIESNTNLLNVYFSQYK